MTRKVQIAIVAGALALGAIVGRASADQPHMQAALGALQTARSKLQEAVADKGGHRVKALKEINEAIDEVKAGIEFDRRH
ncbi:MAG TPA: hypothetical protein VFH92_01990 [Phenylobacterium sp.]|nr:hypothetical protein [Phenylobacterium sp.]